eukprot:6456439-Amphidinium_carterae.1
MGLVSHFVLATTSASHGVGIALVASQYSATQSVAPPSARMLLVMSRTNNIAIIGVPPKRRNQLVKSRS